MEIEVKLPELGDGIKSGDILEVLVRVGDSVKLDQGLLEVETDKATVTLPSTHAGKIAKLLVQPGQTVPIGATVVVLEVDAPAAQAPAPAAPTPAAAAPAPAAAAPPPPPPAAPVTPAAAPPPPAAIAPPAAPVSLPPVRPAAPVAPAAASGSVAPGVGDFDDGHIAAGPAIRRFAREVGVDLRLVEGTGENGRITREDVLEVVRRASQQVTRTATAAVGAIGAAASAVVQSASQFVAHASPANIEAAPAPAAPAQAGESRDAWGPIRVERMTKIRKTIATKMHESWTTVPRVTNMDDADITELEKIRQASKEDYAARGIKLTSLPFVIKAVAMALRNNPVLNASIDMEAGTIIYKDYVNVGIAVDSDRGLVVPSLRAVDELSISEIARRLANTADMVRDNSFAIDDLRGSTFTISNLGAVGGSYATPIINTPEVAILLVGRARQLPVVVDNQIVPRLMLPLSLSYDHRLVDGGAAARFLNEVIAYLKTPSRLLLAP